MYIKLIVTALTLLATCALLMLAALPAFAAAEHVPAQSAAVPSYVKRGFAPL